MNSTDDLAWVVDRNWRVLSPGEPHRCSAHNCHWSAVAVFRRRVAWPRRKRADQYRREWRCARHLNGREVRGRSVYVQARPGSTAARAGYVGEW